MLTVVDKLIEKWTQEERNVIYGALTKLRVGAVKINDVTNTWVMPLSSEIPAKTTQAVAARGYQAMFSAKLVILEPMFEQIEHEIVVTEGRWQKTLWRTKCIEPMTTRTIEHKRIVAVPRAIWRIRGMFIGNRVQFPMERDIAGDLFSPDGTLTLHDNVVPGLDVTVQVENTTSQALPFYAVVIGRGDDR